jgi:hypothetical protein
MTFVQAGLGRIQGLAMACLGDQTQAAFHIEFFPIYLGSGSFIRKYSFLKNWSRYRLVPTLYIERAGVEERLTSENAKS